MKSNFLLPTAMLTLAGWALPVLSAHADVVLSDKVGFVRGTQIFTDTFTLTTPGVLTVTLSAIPWLDTLQNLNCFLTSPGGGVLGSPTNGGLESLQVQPGLVTVNWYAEDPTTGPVGLGVYGIKIAFESITPVPTPAGLPLLLSGLGALSIWGRKRRSGRPAG